MSFPRYDNFEKDPASDRIDISLTQISKEIDRLLAFDMKEKGQTLVQEGEKYKKSHKGEAKKIE